MVKFGSFNVSGQVFYQTRLSYGLVNLKPLVPGHVLVCPLRVVQRVSCLTTEEAQDFYMTVQKISKVIERYYKADSMNIAIQDGPLAGQSVPHVHCHIIPRRLKDFDDVDEIYRLLDGKEGDLEYAFKTIKEHRSKMRLGVDAEERTPRSTPDMELEAQQLANFINQNPDF
jgi:bis(5'-adenosyl)-triphosphatase